MTIHSNSSHYFRIYYKDKSEKPCKPAEATHFAFTTTKGLSVPVHWVSMRSHRELIDIVGALCQQAAIAGRAEIQEELLSVLGVQEKIQAINERLYDVSYDMER